MSEPIHISEAMRELMADIDNRRDQRLRDRRQRVLAAMHDYQKRRFRQQRTTFKEYAR